MIIDTIEEGDAHTRAKVQVDLRYGIDTVHRVDRHTGDAHEMEDDVYFECYPSDFLEYCTLDEMLHAVQRDEVLQDLKGEDHKSVLDALDAVSRDEVQGLIDDLHAAIEAGDMERVAEVIDDYESPHWQSESDAQFAYEAAMRACGREARP